MLYEELKRRNVIRVAIAYIAAAWVVIQVAETLFPIFEFPDNAIRIVVVMLAIGFLPAVTGAWIFEWTPEGLKRDTDVDRSRDDRLKNARRLDRGIIVILLIAVSYFAIDKFVFTGPDVDKGFYGERSIAVMPFEINSTDPEQRFFVNGVTDEIRYLLGTIRDLRVIAERSSNLFHEAGVSIGDIRDNYRIGHLLEGSVRMSGNRVRVSARLVETGTETQLWSDVYERDIDDVFSIQDDIAANVLHNLKIELLGPYPHAREVDPEVLALVQQANQIFQLRGQNTGARMYEVAKRAHELDPDYPEAVKALSAAEWMRAYDRLVPWEEARPRWEALDARYAELVPESGYREANQGFELLQEGELEQAAAMYLRSLEKELADSEQVRQAGRMALTLGKFDVAVRLFEHAVAVDPLCHQCRRMLTQGLMFRGEDGDYRRALDVREQFMAVAATGGLPYKSVLLILLGEPEKVADVWASVDKPDHYQKLAYLAMADYSSGRLDEAHAKLARIEELLAEFVELGTDKDRERDIAHTVAHVSAWMGNADKAFSYLMPPPEDISFYERLAVFDPMWRGIRDDPRWREYRAAIGVSVERLAAIEFDPWLPE